MTQERWPDIRFQSPASIKPLKEGNMLIDAHCHLDVAGFMRIVMPYRAAQTVGVCRFIVPATVRARWQNVLALVSVTMSASA